MWQRTGAKALRIDLDGFLGNTRNIAFAAVMSILAALVDVLPYRRSTLAEPQPSFGRCWRRAASSTAAVSTLSNAPCVGWIERSAITWTVS